MGIDPVNSIEILTTSHRLLKNNTGSP